MRRRGPTGIAVRLMVAMALVVVSGALAAWLVAGGVGPGLFHRHMAEAAASPGTAVEHAETAFASASAVMLAVVLGVSVVTSLVASVVLARRIGASLGAMSQGAAQVASGDLAARVPQPGIGAEFDELADAFNTMAARLDRDETLRRRLMDNILHLRARMQAAGLEVLGDPSPIVPVRVGTEALGRFASRELAARGGIANLVEYPAVPQGGARFRFQVMAAHTRQDVDEVVDILAQAMKTADLQYRQSYESA